MINNSEIEHVRPIPKKIFAKTLGDLIENPKSYINK